MCNLRHHCFRLTLENFEQEGLRREVNLLQKDIGQIKKAKGDASELLSKKNDLDKRIAELGIEVVALGKKRDIKAGMIGNIVDKDCHISSTEVGLSQKSFLSPW